MERTVDLPTPLGSKPCESQQIIRSIGPLGQCPQVPINQDARASLCSSQGAAEFPQLNGPHWRSAATPLAALWGNIRRAQRSSAAEQRTSRIQNC